MSKPMKNMNNSSSSSSPSGGGHGEEASWSLHVDEHGHGGGYEPNALDLTVVGVAWVILVVSLAMTLRYLIRPGEKASDHIKRRILRDGGPR